MFDSVSSVALHSALDGLSLRSRVIADNVANINTPGFLAGQVTFEESLRTAVGGGSGTATASVYRTGGATREDGNNVDLDEQTLQGIETQMRYQLITQAVTNQHSLISASLRTS